MKPKVLFICKRRVDSYCKTSFGLYNSAQFVCDALNQNGIESKLVAVTDNNCIDREVHLYKPTHVIIEALWVVPSKFKVLIDLHPKVRWIVRVHSKTPFIASEGIAIEWLREYAEIKRERGALYVSVNSPEFQEDLWNALRIGSIYLPNIYSPKPSNRLVVDKCSHYIDIGCFGAIRPLKNQLIQAIAAIKFADDLGTKLRFHINGSRVERGQEILKNLQNLFPTRNHVLVCHEWLSHADFINVVRRMDLGMQVSYSESFNIVAADFVSAGVPVVVSPDITWMPPLYQANPNSVKDIVWRMKLAWYTHFIGKPLNRWSLRRSNSKALYEWIHYFETIGK